MFKTIQYTVNSTVIGENGYKFTHKIFVGQPIPNERIFYQDSEYTALAYGHLDYDSNFKYIAIIPTDSIK